MTTRKPNKLTLHQALRGRKDLKSVHRDVLQALASYGNYDLTAVKPSVERICTDYGLAVNTVRAAIRYCREHGYLVQVRAGAGRGNPSEYVIVIPAENPPKDGGVSGEGSNVKPPKVELETLPGSDVKPPKVCAKTPQSLGTNQLETSSLPIKSNQGDADASGEFDIWFKAFPKQVQRAKAKAAYTKVRTKVEADVLLDGANKYRETTLRQRTKREHIRWPANWLAQEGWRDYDVVTFRDWDGHERKMTRAEKAEKDTKEAAEEATREKLWW